MEKEIRDQSFHFTISAFIILFLIWLPFHHVIMCAILGFILGMIREVTEEGVPVTHEKIIKAFTGSKLDLSFWTLGGIFAGVVTI